MKNIIKNLAHIVCAGGIVGFLTFTSMITVAHAAPPPALVAGTLVSGTFDTDVTWTKSGSPYILTGDVTINGPHTLTIEAGVTVSLLPELANSLTAIRIVDGTLNIKGTSTDHVHIEGINKIHTTNSIIDLTFADMSTTGPGLLMYWSHATIASSTFSHSTGAGLALWSSEANIWDSQMKDNAIAGIAISQDAVGRQVSSLKVHNSIITNNGQYGITNSSAGTVSAENNWWGSAEGPMASGTYNTIKGNVNYSPWLISEPELGPKSAVCCSSILFLPGLEATRLYRPESIILGAIPTENQLWEPNRNDDVRKLFMNSNGSSTDASIYAGEPIGKALGLFGVYGSFMKFLDGLASAGTIKEWRSFGYDWRKPVAEVVAGRTKKAEVSESLIETVESLASRSRTGKVTIIAHSNGGLVTKYLVKTLADMGKESLIDSVISVAVPYLGTPQAILGLLHGDRQSLAGGLILKKSVAREFGTNLGSAYSLVPSATYFTKIFSPTIAYASSTSTPIVVSSAQDSFISSRTNGLLMTAAEIFHSIIDPFAWPATIARWTIVGWGNKTAKGIVYTGADTSATSTYSVSVTSMGDGTVIAPSAAYNSGTTTAINLPLTSDLEKRDIKHSNILESSATKESINKIITSSPNAPGYDAKAVEDALTRIPGVTIGEPDYSKEATFLVVSTHSPVDLHVYDKNGNHTGFAPIPPEYGIEDDVFSLAETNIPGSSFETHGDEDQPETYISLPDNKGEKYSVMIQGTGVGEFSYDVKRIRGDVTLSSVEYAGLPVTPLMTASTTVTAGILSTTTVLTLDVDGNGSIDVVAQPNSNLDPIIFFESLKKTILQLSGGSKTTDGVVRTINKIEEMFSKNRLRRIDSTMNTLKSQIGSKKLVTLTQSDKEEIISMIDQFLAQF